MVRDAETAEIDINFLATPTIDLNTAAFQSHGLYHVA